MLTDTKEIHIRPVILENLDFKLVVLIFLKLQSCLEIVSSYKLIYLDKHIHKVIYKFRRFIIF